MEDRTLPLHPSSDDAARPLRVPWLTGVAVAAVIIVVLVSAAIRLATDVRSVVARTVPPDPYAARFVGHPWFTYLHIGRGVLYLVGVPLQLTYRFRRKHYRAHRRLGRLLWGAGVMTGLFAILIGVTFPFGGPVEGAATVVFGIWFLVCLVLALHAVKSGDVVLSYFQFSGQWYLCGICTVMRLWLGFG